VPRRRKRSLKVHLDHRIPLVLGHIRQHAVAQDAGIVDEDIEPAEGVDGLLDHGLRALPIAYIGRIGDSRAAGLLDGVHYGRGCSCIGARAIDAGADVVDHDLGAMGRKQEGVLASESSPGPRHDGHPTFT
jgi:hypothetical protein